MKSKLYVRSKTVSRLYLHLMHLEITISRWKLIPVSGKVTVPPHLKVGLNVGIFCVGIIL